jgi:SAM-dependent methyltransferase
MKNLILKNKIFYRLYQNIIRAKKNDYDFIKFIFEKNNSKINVLDICCGDSYILKYISKYVENYTGLDNNKSYLKQSKKDYPNFKFHYLDIKKIKSLNAGKINFIFLNGAIHHFNDKIINDLLNYINKKFPKAIFLSIDPLRANNNFINKFMINNDRGKFIRNKKQYKKIMGKFSRLITKDFLIIKFLIIIHYKNIDLKKKFAQWKKNGHWD